MKHRKHAKNPELYRLINRYAELLAWKVIIMEYNHEKEVTNDYIWNKVNHLLLRCKEKLQSKYYMQTPVNEFYTMHLVAKWKGNRAIETRLYS